jgi:hypothetical protein
MSHGTGRRSEAHDVFLCDEGACGAYLGCVVGGVVLPRIEGAKSDDAALDEQRRSLELVQRSRHRRHVAATAPPPQDTTITCALVVN